MQTVLTIVYKFALLPADDENGAKLITANTIYTNETVLNIRRIVYTLLLFYGASARLAMQVLCISHDHYLRHRCSLGAIVSRNTFPRYICDGQWGGRKKVILLAISSEPLEIGPTLLYSDMK